MSKFGLVPVLAPGGYELEWRCVVRNGRESVLRASQNMFTGQSDVEVDLSAVEKTDSAGLALLLEWISLARQSGTDIRFSGIPEKIHAIAQTAEIEELLAPGYSTSSSK